MLHYTFFYFSCRQNHCLVIIDVTVPRNYHGNFAMHYLQLSVNAVKMVQFRW